MSYPHPMDDKTGFEATDAEMGLPGVKTDERFTTCPECGGEGEVGTGRMSHSVDSATIDPPWEITERCSECNGSGWVWECR